MLLLEDSSGLPKSPLFAGLTRETICHIMIFEPLGTGTNHIFTQ